MNYTSCSINSIDNQRLVTIHTQERIQNSIQQPVQKKHSKGSSTKDIIRFDDLLKNQLENIDCHWYRVGFIFCSHCRSPGASCTKLAYTQKSCVSTFLRKRPDVRRLTLHGKVWISTQTSGLTALGRLDHKS